MSIETVRDVFLWCAVISYGLLLWWFLLFTIAHDRVHRLWSRWFRLSVEQFDVINCAGIVFLKASIFLLYLVPYIALRMVS